MLRWQLLVPVKGTIGAKTRLGDEFPLHRPRLALAFARDTVAAAAACDLVDDVTVTTGDAAAAAAFVGMPAHVFEDSSPGGLNVAISVAVQDIPRLRDAKRVAVLLGDVPALTPSALAQALRLAATHPTAFVPDASGTGTTLLCATSGTALQPRFGAGSAAKHEAGGAARLSDNRIAALRRDVDDVDDLLEAMRLGLGEHTARLLREVGWAGPDAARPSDESLIGPR